MTALNSEIYDINIIQVDGDGNESLYLRLHFIR
ncbi:hypothetical protein FBZ94_11046 [Bradyrhizobium sacchari]|uniref:Uncharacterized protein n=1 Tax=Bradyrhizobium sacchari TaxID=1399419 RepID=A0A560JMB6_9BRAD|nr:hypothetical protein FBZ94_11046 [Bradyrhizobium sacchari]TWB69450.1 hypothetical protein FBZ95_10946 [Bradyrhizobium sacchari]